IVSEIAGTTRDSIESYADVRGIPVLIIDTAGIREVNDPLEKLGVERTEDLITKADVTLFVIDASKSLDAEDVRVAERFQSKEIVVLMNKADLGVKVSEDVVHGILPKAICVEFSAVTGQGLDALVDVVETLVYGGRVKQEESLLVTNVRHENLLRAALTEIDEAETMLIQGEAFDFSEINMKTAYENLGEITGKTVTDEVLEKVFSRFCVGK
ncbi:MAG: GTP-binding protein, partial [Clostridiales Family XIII bacterium]|nr:GTP-binding protein [Clostridiales Family XIII bacterium]